MPRDTHPSTGIPFSVRVLAVSLLLPGCDGYEAPSVEDPGLSACIGNMGGVLGHEEESVEFDVLTYLTCDGSDIQTLSGIGAFFALRNLFLGKQRIADISPLGDLEHLQTAYLSDNQIVALHGLSGLTSLRVLDLSQNAIVDVSPLASLVNLVHLDLSRNPIVAGVSDLAASTNLYEINLVDSREIPCDDIALLKGERPDLTLFYSGCAPAAPSGLMVSDFTLAETNSGTEASFTLSWDPVAEAARYHVSWSRDANPDLLDTSETVEWETRLQHQEYIDDAMLEDLTEETPFYFFVSAESEPCFVGDEVDYYCEAKSGPSTSISASPTIER